MVQKLWKQLIRDLKSSWQKAAVLGILLVVGLVFWIPQLVRAVSEKSVPRPAETRIPAAATLPPIQAETTFKTGRNDDGDSAQTGPTWENADALLSSDPLVRPVDVAAIHGDPFRIDHDQFPPPVLFAKEPKLAKTALPDANQAETGRPNGLTLKSTIVGVKRRAAFINKQLYYEGTDVEAEGETYHLRAVFRNKVLLSRGNRMFELTIVERSPNGNIRFKRHVTDDGR